ncbi:hypothetical protein TUM4438_41640 [Shewanella sairae]|uniref:Tandem-95 repeat protein n=1 Tax=Shewanella sairae TaxID=190310 RepID=A0ABQ4PQN8_9GAMM|nr:tandem-95 repeat protein [Shewanella sairae]MCL1132374.1 tandem-95 repeat protein [Shewanella sairae]GIU51559.1 hypothetical protein TUM4438_41640 [Shewanella sairae]
MKTTLLTKSLIGTSLMFALIGCGDDTGYLDKPAPPTPPPTSLVAAPLTLKMKVDERRTVDLSDSVTALDIAAWTVSSVNDAEGLGRVENIQAHTFDYEALAAGVTSLHYTVKGGGETASSEVLVAVHGDMTGDNIAPVALNVTEKTKNNKNLGIDLTKFISDADGDSLKISHVVSSSGRFIGTEDGIVTFKPDGFVGVDSAAYSVEDSHGGYDIAYIVVTSEDANPTKPNTAPTAKDIHANINSVLTPVWKIDLVKNNIKDTIFDADGDKLSIVEIFDGNGRATFNGTTISYTPGSFTGIDQFTYVISDGREGFATGTVTLTVSNGSDSSNQIPTASPLTLSNVDDSDTRPLEIDLSDNVKDADGDTLRLVSVIGANGNAQLVANSPLQVSYTIPNPPQGLKDTFAYVVTDGKGGYAMSTVTVEMVTGNPNAPETVIANLKTEFTKSLTINLADYISDAETSDNNLTVSNLRINNVPSSHKAKATLTGQVVTYVPNSFIGADILTYTVSDGEHETLGVIAITSYKPSAGAAHSFTAGHITQSFDLGAGVTGGSLNWQDKITGAAAGDIASVTAIGARLGTVTVNPATNALNYTAASGKYGTDQFIYKLTDKHSPAHEAVGLVTVDITPPEAPEITELTIEGTPTIGGVLTANVTCARCDDTKYQYRWVINGLVTGTDKTYTYRAENVGFNVRLEVVGMDAYGRLVKKGTTYAMTPRLAKQVVYTFDLKNTGILYNTGVFKTFGTAPGVANREVNNIKEVIPDSTGFILIDNNNDISAFGGTGSPTTADKGNASKVVRTGNSNAVLRTDNSVFAWGSYDKGGNIPSNVEPYTTAEANVKSIVNSFWGFAVLNANGDVASWGYDFYDQTATPDDNPELRGIKQILSDGHTWLGIKNNGSIVRWGSSFDNSDYELFNDVKDGFTDVTSLTWGARIYIGLNKDGSAVSWGDKADGAGGNKEALTSGVAEVAALDAALIARKSNGEFYAWGNIGDITISLPQNDVKKFVENNYAIATLTNSGAVSTLGNSRYGADSSTVSEHLSSGVIDIIPGTYGFVALKGNGTAVTWGVFDNPPPSPVITDVISVERVWGVFFAHKKDGSIVSWGSNRLQAVSEIEAALKFSFEQIM